MRADQDALSNRQASLIKMIFAGVTVKPERAEPVADKGLQIYQNNLLMTAARALSLSYPVTEKMLGEETMRLLCRHLLSRELPSSGDWADWGGQLSDLIRTTSLQDGHPYLADIAELEWLIHRAARAAPTELDIASLSRLADENLSDLRLYSGSGLNIIRSLYPTAELWQIHQQDVTDIDTEEVGRLLSQPPRARYLLICQKDHLPCITHLTEEEYLWMAALQAGQDLASLLEQFPAFDFSQWLTRAIEQQWLHKLT
ncbi:HvfC/BufC family peptide modification chaperone [Neptuniibacter halophilus]|uniref:HvfC/BufC family peptide modification chaperone n=1 Tax=Neptuniibacter halophilus TaxID=651666 RepID=UPI002572A4B1|nr:putative DNA-binding domain-containing protein [Neptuniibacter halophilus]